MNLRTTIGAAVLAGTLTVGGAAPALADEPRADPPPRACVAARHVLHDLRVLERHLRHEARRVQAAIDRARAAGRDDLADRLQVRLDRLEARHAHVVERVQDAVQRVRDRCTDEDAPAT